MPGQRRRTGFRVRVGLQQRRVAAAHPETTSYAYDALNRQVEEIDASGTSAQSITTTVYDANGNALSNIDPTRVPLRTGPIFRSTMKG